MYIYRTISTSGYQSITHGNIIFVFESSSIIEIMTLTFILFSVNIDI